MPVDLYSSALVALVVVLAGIIGIRSGISTPILEVTAGIILGNFLGVGIEPWLDFLGTFGGLALTFLAGTEIDLTMLGNKMKKQSITLGTIAFIVPLFAEMLFLKAVTDWSLLAILAIGLALTATAVAVVYTLLLETGFLETHVSRLILATVFVNDFLTLVGINLIAHEFNQYTIIFFLTIILIIFSLPKLLEYLVHNYGKRSAEIELRFVFAVLLAISFLADAGRMQAIFGAFILGLVFSHSIHSYQDILPKLRSITFSLLSPAFFIRAGLLISLPAVMQNLVLIMGLLAVKILSKFLGTYPLCKRWIPEAPVFSTMLFSTGLTIGIITLTFGKSAGYLNQAQFSIAMISVIMSALIPTIIARKFTPKSLGPSSFAESKGP